MRQLSLLNGQTGTTADPLLSLASRLIDPQDRETYAALVSYIHSLPPEDELFRLAHLLGFLSLLGQRLPEALNGFLEALAEQLNGSGLQNTAVLLKQSSTEIQALSGQLAACLKPLSEQYTGVGSMVSTELAKLGAETRALHDYNAARDARQRREWVLEILFSTVLLLLGVLAGVWWEKGKTLDAIGSMEARIVQHLQTPQPAPADANCTSSQTQGGRPMTNPFDLIPPFIPPLEPSSTIRRFRKSASTRTGPSTSRSEASGGVRGPACKAWMLLLCLSSDPNPNRKQFRELAEKRVR